MNVLQPDANEHVLPKYLPLLVMLYCTILCTCAILAQYVADIHGFVFTEGASLMPLMYFCGDIITEVYGYKVARRVIWSALISVLFFMLLIMAMVQIPSPHFWHLQAMYQFMYDRFTRVIFCMIVIIPMSEFANSYILSKLKILWKGRRLWLRSLTSSLSGEILVAVTGNLILFAGKYDVWHLAQIIFASFIIKAVFSSGTAWLCAVLARQIKKAEKLDVYDYNVNYNPFKFFS